MKRVLAVIATLTLAGALAAPASAAPRRTIRVVEHALTDATTDTGAAGDSAGDILTFANPVFNRADARQVGSDQGYCIRVDVGTSYECTWTNFLKGGQIVVQGPFYDAKPSELAITGGTGKYATARGSMRLEAIEGGKGEEEFSFVFHLR